MAVKHEVFEGIAVVTIDGELADEAVAEAREAVVARVERDGLRQIVVDLSACTSIASTGLECLLHAASLCEDRRGRLKLAGCEAYLLKILAITRLRSRFECSDNLETALRSLRV